VILHQNEQELHHAEPILRNYLEKYFVWLELLDLQVASHTFEGSDFLKKKKKTALLNSHLLFYICSYIYFLWMLYVSFLHLIRILIVPEMKILIINFSR